MSDDRTTGRGPSADGSRGEGVDRPDDLMADFRSLAEDLETSGRIPDFHRMMDRVHAEVGDEDHEAIDIAAARSSEDARRDLMRFGRWIPLAAAAAVAGLLVFGGGTDGDDEFERLVADYSASAAGWRSPTASLMDIPGVDLGAVPSIGGTLRDIDLPDTDFDEGRDS